MVKVMKHELYAIFRVLIFLAAASLVFAAAGRLTIEVSRSGDSPLSVLFGVFYICFTFLLVFEAWLLGVTRFYKTLFTGEGYLTLSLPVPPARLILGKLLSSVIAVVASSLVCALSFLILTAGAPQLFLFEAFGEIFTSIGNAIAEEPVVLFELIVLILTWLPLCTLVLYAVLALAQLFSSHRKLVIFALLVLVYVVVQIFLTYCMVPIVEATDAVSPHLTVWLVIAVLAAIDGGSFFFVRYILANKINLL